MRTALRPVDANQAENMAASAHGAAEGVLRRVGGHKERPCAVAPAHQQRALERGHGEVCGRGRGEEGSDGAFIKKGCLRAVGRRRRQQQLNISAV